MSPFPSLPPCRAGLWPALCAAPLLIAPAANALTAQQLYQQAQQQVLALERLDKQGQVQSYTSALWVAPGKAVTQCDQLDNAEGLRLKLGERLLQARLEKRDASRNLCLLDVPGAGPVAVAARREDDPPPGTAVFAVGNALGMGVSIAEGVVAGVRQFSGENYVQFTAAIAPGSEGGGLFDAEGRLVGMISYRPRDGQNINFALPARWLGEVEQRSASADGIAEWQGKAQALSRDANWKALAELAQRWTTALGDSSEGWLWLTLAHSMLKDWPAAEQAARQALRIEPGLIEAGLSLSEAQVQQGKAAEGLATAQALLAQRQENARIWLAIGHAELARQHLAEARQALERAAGFAPWNYAVQLGLSRLAYQRGDWNAMVAAQQQLTRLSPGNVDSWILLSDACRNAGRPERALASADRALELAPDNGDAWVGKGNALHQLKRDQEAIAALQKGLGLKPLRAADGWVGLGDVYYTLGLFPEAINAYRQARRIAPDGFTPVARLQVALKDNYQFDEAMRLAQQIKAEHPDDPFPHRQIGFIDGYQGQYEQGIPALERSLALNPNQAKVWVALLEQYMGTGRRDEAVRAYRKLAAIDAGAAENAYRRLFLPYGITP